MNQVLKTISEKKISLHLKRTTMQEMLGLIIDYARKVKIVRIKSTCLCPPIFATNEFLGGLREF